MIEWPFLFAAGFLGSSHCLGMCGGFALALGSGASGVGANLWRQVAYTIGRVFTYATLGALAGYGGWRFAKLVPFGIDVAAWLAVLAGLVLMVQGLAAAGWIRRPTVSGSSAGCPGTSLFAMLFSLPGPWRPFLAGVFTGFLPCGLLYGMLALAASTHHWMPGMIAMIVFGAGTAPVMIATGLGGSVLSHSARQRLWKVAAWCLVIAGTVSLARGAAVLLTPGASSTASCPLCRP